MSVSSYHAKSPAKMASKGKSKTIPSKKTASVSGQIGSLPEKPSPKHLHIKPKNPQSLPKHIQRVDFLKYIVTSSY